MEDALISYFGTDPGDLTADEMHGRTPDPVPRPSETPPEKLRLDAYYYGFDPTGVIEIDRILSAVAVAGKGYHHTEYWNEPLPEGDTYVERIQAAAKAAAEAFRRSPSVPTATQEQRDAGVADATNRNIRTMELANAVANHLGLNPADEIPFEELTRRLWELPPVDGFGSHKADLAELRLLQSWREQAIQDIEALPAHIVEFSGHAMSDPPILVKHLDRDRVLSILRGST